VFLLGGGFALAEGRAEPEENRIVRFSGGE